MHKEQDEKMLSQYDPEVIRQLKKEIVEDLEDRREWQEKYHRGGYGRSACPPMYSNRKRRNNENDWWTDREAYDHQRNMSLARNQLRDELRALDKINQRLGQVRDPQIRQTLYDLLYEAREQGMGIQELLQSLNMNDGDPGYIRPLWNRVTSPFRGINRRSFGWGLSAALVGLLLLPSISKSVRPLIRRTMEEAMDINERVQSVFAQAKEELEDIVAEASFSKLTASLKEDPAANGGMAEKDVPPQDNGPFQNSEPPLNDK
ncbi:MAG: hypothetical protein A4E55_02321 [Pelotomaculum sp. PtaU1.Bin035]|nr:MAG: hypothetical protein A4E55_02321 [Pelotomaculum sp. PtaU1.Bin035]